MVVNLELANQYNHSYCLFLSTATDFNGGCALTGRKAKGNLYAGNGLDVGITEQSLSAGLYDGLAGKEDSECPYDNDVLVAAWEAGKDDGLFQYQRSLKERKHMRFA